MEPPVTQDSQPYVLLTFSTESVYYNQDVLRSLQHGDEIKFNCTLHQRPTWNLKDLMHFHVDNMEAIGHSDAYAMFTTDVE